MYFDRNNFQFQVVLHHSIPNNRYFLFLFDCVWFKNEKKKIEITIQTIIMPSTNENWFDLNIIQLIDWSWNWCIVIMTQSQFTIVIVSPRINNGIFYLRNTLLCEKNIRSNEIILERAIVWFQPQPIEIIDSGIEIRRGINSCFVVVFNPNCPNRLIPHE